MGNFLVYISLLFFKDPFFKMQYLSTCLTLKSNVTLLMFVCWVNAYPKSASIFSKL